MLNDILMLIVSYLIGSIPFGMILSFCAGYGDLRKFGSGNIGATNVLRTGNKLVALLTLLCDGSKVVLAILLAKNFGFDQVYLIGGIGVLGHLFPVWLKFKGGKGVASFFGLSLYLFPITACFMLLTWVFVFAVSRYSSLAAIVSIICGGVMLINHLTGIDLYLMMFIMLLIIYKHKDNISRLISGKELKI